MSMSIEEAKGKWCPMVRNIMADARTGRNYNRVGGKVDKNSTCVADKCMLWRYYSPETYEGYCGLSR